MPRAKVKFLKAHELGHGLLPWQRDAFAATADCEQTLSSEISDIFEREANAFASEVLFQLDKFTDEASSREFGIKVPISLARQYGTSVYSSVRRYVSANRQPCAVLVLEPPDFSIEHGLTMSVRRIEYSKAFTATVGRIRTPETLTMEDPLGPIVPVTAGRKMSSPREVVLSSKTGLQHLFVAEAFSTPYSTFVLLLHKRIIGDGTESKRDRIRIVAP